MSQIETTAIVNPDGKLTVEPVLVSDDIPPGEYRAIVDLEPQSKQEERGSIEFLVLDIPWPADLSLRREDIYGDWGR